ncbi:nickel/cobalt transporter [Maridesulfovibrio zosterae]|uniref:nickel/cobalt transporter n=1 Tax=Maridesulfovibrio zosterae TaxID=82171 RepID=UPI0003FFF499|nr:nickel ABC transporter permease [Maridesulfovibrio zosterae]
MAKAQCATNPFLTKQNQDHSQTQSSIEKSSRFAVKTRSSKNSAGLYEEVLTRITLIQKEIRTKLTGFAKNIKINPFGKSLWLFMSFAFAYGIVHAVGPGHGKSVVCAYFISRGGSMLAASLMSWVITLVHVGSAAFAVSLAYLFFSSGMSGFESFNYHLQTGSYALVALIGVWLVIGAMRSFARNGTQRCCQPHQQDSFKEIITVAFFTGIVPCPGAAIILVYTLSTGILWAGLIAMFFLATGMAVTTSLFAFTAAKTRCILDKTASNKLTRLYSIFALTGALVIMFFGAIMLAAHLS